MTIYIKSENVANHNITIRQEKFEDVYRVRDYDIKCECIDSDLIYPTFDKAKTRYNYLCRKYRKGE